MAKLAIKGHQKRGSEVIALLEMLGGINYANRYGYRNNVLYYIFPDNNEIMADSLNFSSSYSTFTLEEFLERFPYKVGDKVYYDNKVCDVIEMLWNSNLNTISYGVYDGKMKNLTITEDLKPYRATEEFYKKYCINCGSQRCTAEGEWLKGCAHYKEETMSKNICDSCLDNEGCWVECSRKKQEREKETKKDLDWPPTEYLEFENNYDAWANEVEVNLGNDYKIQIRDGKTFIVRKIPQYPKTYEECCKVLCCKPIVGFAGLDDDEENLYGNFIALKRCRNAYLKIAGEQMGLGESWKPDFTNDDEERYGIYTSANKVKKDFYGGGDINTILTFPTEEMRNTFFENFKDLIEECKELL